MTSYSIWHYGTGSSWSISCNISRQALKGTSIDGLRVAGRIIQSAIDWIDIWLSLADARTCCELGRSDSSILSERKMMVKRFLVTFALLVMLASAPAAAQFTGQIGYAHITDDFDLGAIVGSFGMELDVTDNFALVPEVRAGLGVRNDTVGGVKLELDHLYGVANRFQFNASESFYLFGSLSYIRYKVSASMGSVSASDNSWEWGYGGGLGYRFNQGNALDLSYERVDGVDIITAGWRFRF